jgi:hypothetical protein
MHISWTGIVRLVTVGGLLLAGVALGPGPASARAKLTEPQKVSNAQLHTALHTLRVTNQTLKAADHDYGGHREAAIKAVTAAEHQLKLALEAVSPHHPKKEGQVARGGTHPKEPEPQDISNVQLAESIGVLKDTIRYLRHTDEDYGGHRAHAIRDLEGAVAQLQLALQFEKNKGK